MPDESTKICPIIWTESLTEGRQYVGCGSQCAWYIPEKDCCAINLMCRELVRSREQLEALRHLGRLR